MLHPGAAFAATSSSRPVVVSPPNHLGQSAEVSHAPTLRLRRAGCPTGLMARAPRPRPRRAQ
eukprot:1590034-Pyramimonas_sp.AAC.1